MRISDWSSDVCSSDLRSSQINGCAYCIDMHTADARKDGETERRLYAVTAWREAPFFTPRERAALAWTEALTRLSDTHAPDADRKSVGSGKGVSVRVDLGGRGTIKKKNKNRN